MRCLRHRVLRFIVALLVAGVGIGVEWMDDDFKVALVNE
jgi:hypothetical protein